MRADAFRRHALRAMMTEMEELDTEKTIQTQQARKQVKGGAEARSVLFGTGHFSV